MASTAENVIAKDEMAKEKVSSENGMKAAEHKANGKAHDEETPEGEVPKEDQAKKEEVAVEVEPKTGVSFPVKLDDGKQLSSVGVRKKSMLGMGIKIYGFGMYTDNEKMKNVLKSKIGNKAPEKPNKELYQVAIDSDVEMTVRLVIVFSSLTMNMVKKNFDEGLGASIKKLSGGKKNDELANKVMGQASDNIKLTPGSLIEISRLPGYVLQTTVMGEVISKVDSELLCRAYTNMYLGDDPLDKDAKDKFGMYLLSLF
ncbi:hypothetical protein PTKIN_Ptkin08bG0027200 [Pterospermum kingtungense]